WCGPAAAPAALPGRAVVRITVPLGVSQEQGAGGAQGPTGRTAAATPRAVAQGGERRPAPSPCRSGRGTDRSQGPTRRSGGRRTWGDPRSIPTALRSPYVLDVE